MQNGGYLLTLTQPSVARSFSVAVTDLFIVLAFTLNKSIFSRYEHCSHQELQPSTKLLETVPDSSF